MLMDKLDTLGGGLLVLAVKVQALIIPRCLDHLLILLPLVVLIINLLVQRMAVSLMFQG